MTNTETTSEKPKKKNPLLWGCLIVLVLAFMGFCCIFTVVGLSAFTDFDPLGLDLDQQIPWEDYLDDPSLMPGDQEEPSLEDEFYEEDSYAPEDSTDYAAAEGEISLVPYSAVDFYASFSYPEGWEVQEEDYRVTFVNPHSYTYLYVGEDIIDEGTTAADVAADVMANLQDEAEEGTFVMYESGPYNLFSGDDAYFSVYEWTDLDGYWQFAYDLEIVHGDSNIFFFLVGENPSDFDYYRHVMEDIAASFSR
jgi:hypothetical protein